MKGRLCRGPRDFKSWRLEARASHFSLSFFSTLGGDWHDSISFTQSVSWLLAVIAVAALSSSVVELMVGDEILGGGGLPSGSSDVESERVLRNLDFLVGDLYSCYNCKEK